MGMNVMVDPVSQLRLSLHRPQDWPYSDDIDHPLFQALMKTSHDVGGEPDAPVAYEEKEEEQWELNTYVLAEVIGWRGIWVSEERRRLANVDLGRTAYLGLPYYGRWLWSIARVFLEKRHITLGELIERVDEVRSRALEGNGGGVLEAAPHAVGDGTSVRRNRHHIEAVGQGDPVCYTGMADAPRFAVGDRVFVRTLPTFFYTRTQEYLRGLTGTVAKVSYESPAPEDEAFDREEAKPEWFYIVRFAMTDIWTDYAGCPNDTLQAEIVERWLRPVA